ncbi:MAG TPA: DUF2809 domain-containing protein [Gemmatimonadaceae bacterium]|jgi:hypothetical protein|nr:DUF2809 domain-containing protein [Gemmatimonadaceae bacterium]
MSAAAAAIATMLLGLWIHRGGLALGPDARDVAGDALWACMMAWIVAVTAPAASMFIRGGIAFAISCAVEFSQLVHTPVLDAWRATTIGGLVLGSGFNPRDLAAYAGGVALAIALESIARRASNPSQARSPG